jgi:hypothetical protein
MREGGKEREKARRREGNGRKGRDEGERKRGVK